VQAFLAVRFARPALQLPEPNVLRVEVAPINIAYSQACFSAVLAFVDAAWPNAAFDPLRVLASVTLANTVQVELGSIRALSASCCSCTMSLLHVDGTELDRNCDVQERLAAPAALPAVRLSSKRLQLEVTTGRFAYHGPDTFH
jgi:hypothetical protein